MAQAAKVLIRRVISLWVPAQNAERFLDSQRHACCSKPTQTIPTAWVKHHADVPTSCREGKQLLPSDLPHRDHFQVIRGSELQNTTSYKLFIFIFLHGKRMGKAACPHTSYHPSPGKPAQEVLTVCSKKGLKKQVLLETTRASSRFYQC